MGFIYVPLQRCPESRSLAQMQITLKSREAHGKKEENEYKSDDSMSPRSFGFVWF